MTSRLNVVWRGAAMLGVILLVSGLSLGSAGWAQVARAQTVPTLTFTPAPTLAGSPRPTAILPSATPSLLPDAGSATAPPSATPVGATGTPDGVPATPGVTGSPDAACGSSPVFRAAQVRVAPVQLVTGIGALTLLGLDGLDDQSGAPMIVSQFGVEIVPNDQLPTAPTGWRLPGCGLQATAKGAAGQSAAFLTRGLTACLAKPDDSASPSTWRLAYFNTQPGPARWVFVPSHDTAGQLCSTPFRLPALFALLARTS